MLARISNTPRDYAWGSTTLIAELVGREPTGKPEAEVWFGGHPGSPAVLEGGEHTLETWFAGRGDGDDRLPYLLKILAAGAPLSIQVHPSKLQAEMGFAREETAGTPRDAAHRNYRDDNHKPEVIVALSDEFVALAGIRDLSDTLRLLGAVGPGVDDLREILDIAEPSASVRAAIAWVFSDAAADAVPAIIAACAAARSDEFADELALVRVLAETYPSDPGVVVALLMNLVRLERGAAIFVPAGVLHAYVAGLGVELMAASDNVLRGGLTPKHVDVPELLAILDPTPSSPPVLHPEELGTGLRMFDPGVVDFALVHAVVAGEPTEVAVRGHAIVLATHGAVSVETASGARDLVPGDAVFVTEDETHVILTGAGECFVAMPGIA